MALKLCNLDESPAEFTPTKHRLDLIFELLFFLKPRLFFFTMGAILKDSPGVENLWDPEGRIECFSLKKYSGS